MRALLLKVYLIQCLPQWVMSYAAERAFISGAGVGGVAFSSSISLVDRANQLVTNAMASPLTSKARLSKLLMLSQAW